MKFSKTVYFWLKSLLLASLIWGVSIGDDVSSRVVGNRAMLNPVLVTLEEQLDSKGIDVVSSGGFRIALSGRPRVVELSGMEITNRDYSSAPWMNDFVTGATGFIAGVLPDGQVNQASDSDAFLALWHTTSKDRRVFISFTAADIDYATRVQEALESQGYVAFIFLNRPSVLGARGPTPRYNATLVGSMFREAGNHLLIDTPNARKSPGVFLEASLMASILIGPPPPSPPPVPIVVPPLKPRPSPSLGAADFDETKFTAGVTGDWVVTENPQHRGVLYVHQTQTSDGTLIGLLYLIQVGSDGSWAIYDPDFPIFGPAATKRRRSLGRHVGSIASPPNVQIGPCTCNIFQ
jgi:hypothetical protein